MGKRSVNARIFSGPTAVVRSIGLSVCRYFKGEFIKYWIAFTFVLFILLSAGCTNISIRTAVEIDAPKEQVYTVLADLDSYPKWNPYHRKVEGEFKEGEKLKIYVSRPDGKKVEVPPHMIRIVENEEITWGGGVKGIFYGVHTFKLQSSEQGKTVLRHNEDFSGIAVGFADLPPDVIAEGYHQMNMALKALVEGNK